MPRILNSNLLKAYNKSPLLQLVFRGTRNLPSAINELRWLKEHVEETFTGKKPMVQKQELLQLCRRRSRGEPLQYILGSQPFGELDIKCRPGVLIPRPETEAYTTFLAQLITSHQLDRAVAGKFVPDYSPLPAHKAITHLKILDLCTGSGCIALLLKNLTSKSSSSIEIHGWDISEDAIALANENWTHNVQLGHLGESPPLHPRVNFKVVDIFDPEDKLLKLLTKESACRKSHRPVDIIISNPPYISQKAFRKETTSSVRNWEPKLALVPGKLTDSKSLAGVDAADIFYHRLLELHRKFKSKVLLMEVGDQAQAIRVAKMAINSCGMKSYVEIWRDSPGLQKPKEIKSEGLEIPVRGSGSIRAVALFNFSAFVK